jgi:TetR/AcrR family transcriptional repressor of nem operon
VEAAREVFWQHGLEGTAITDLEAATGLSRSSLYLAFEAKRGLFDAALANYLDTFIQPLLDPLEAPGASLPEAAAFFDTLAAMFGDPRSRRGCLMLNTIGELAGRDPTFTTPANAHANHLRAAFSNALKGAMSRREAARRSELLASATLGVWMAVRADPRDAAATCRAVAAEIASWTGAEARVPARQRGN